MDQQVIQEQQVPLAQLVMRIVLVHIQMRLLYLHQYSMVLYRLQLTVIWPTLLEMVWSSSLNLIQPRILKVLCRSMILLLAI